MISYEKLRAALTHLEAQHRNLQSLEATQPRLIQEAVAESVIQRFETCYDCLWKVLKRHLVEELGLPQVPNSPKPVFRLAHENHLLPGSVTPWLAYANARIATAHDYSGEKAEAAIALMDGFLKDAIGLFEKLSGASWA